MPRFGSLRELSEVADLVEQHLDDPVVISQGSALPLDLAGELDHAQRQVGVGSDGGAHADQGADDQHADFHRATGPQHVEQHQAAVLSEGEGKPGRVSVLLGTSRTLRKVRLTFPYALQSGRILRPLPASFVGAQPENEVCSKSRRVPAHLRVRPLRLHAIQMRQIRIQHDPLPAQLDDVGGLDDGAVMTSSGTSSIPASLRLVDKNQDDLLSTTGNTTK
jgi:hypothetical protein